MTCIFCSKEIPGTDKIHRRDMCPFCEHDLHVCVNCEFFEPKSFHQCRESNAEFVEDKEKSNPCDYFRAIREKRSFIKKSENARKKLEELFKKPGE